MLKQRARPIEVSGQPTFERPDSQMVSAAQIYEPAFAKWAQYFDNPICLDRKTWEYCYIAQAIDSYAGLTPGKRGLCFGAGKEFLPAIFASRGVEIVATDWMNQDHDWQTKAKNDLFFPHLVEQEPFDRLVSLTEVDMNNIPSDLSGFDFIWSTGCLEHIGSHRNGMAFVENAMSCLKPGGIAVHTTEFTISSRTVSQDVPELSFYCEQDIRELATRLTEQGHLIVLNFQRGDTIADMHVDTPPYRKGMTLAAHFSTHIITSIGLIVQKDGIARFD